MSYRTVFQNPCPDQDFASALFLQQTGGEMPESLDSLCKDNARIISSGNPKRRIQSLARVSSIICARRLATTIISCEIHTLRMPVDIRSVCQYMATYGTYINDRPGQ